MRAIDKLFAGRLSEWLGGVAGKKTSRRVIFLLIFTSQIGLALTILWLLGVDRSITPKYSFAVYVVLFISLIFFGICDYYLVRAMKSIEKKAAQNTEMQLMEQAKLTEAERLKTLEELYSQEQSFHRSVDEKLQGARRLYQQDRPEEARQVLAELGRSIADFKRADYCDDALVNTVLNNKAVLAAENNVNIKFSVRVGSFPCSGAELCSLFSNVLDNGIEACCALPEGSSRWVRLNVSVWNGLLLVHCENTAKSGLSIRDGRAVSTKRDSGSHGWGLEILRHIAQTYQGELDTQFADGVFTLRLTLQYPEKEAEG